jgi:glycine oxidase
MTLRADIVVAGAGAVGSTIALVLARAGYSVVVVDPAEVGDNASGVAAGMLAPAFEALFDAPSRDRFELLRQARDLWVDFARSVDLGLDRQGALAVGAREEASDWASAMRRFGAEARVLPPEEAGARSPRFARGWAVFTPDDWRLEPLDALRALRRAAEASGARWVSGRVIRFSDGRAALDGERAIAAGKLVVATGASHSLTATVPEVRLLTPVKGHILRAARRERDRGPVVRGAGIYLCASSDDLILGASMETGRSDVDVDTVVVADLIGRAGQLSPDLAALDWRAAAGVRAATPDGLPLVGRSAAPHVLLAVGARRNGWLLAPLIAGVLRAALEGGPTSTVASLFDPRRLVSLPG